GISTDTVSVFIFDENNPAADAGLDQELCVPQDSTLLAGNTPIFPAIGTWTLINGAGNFTDPNDPTTQVSGLAIGPNTFRWTVDNGPCANPITFDEITVILFDDSTAAANAGPDLEICLPQTSTTMQGETPQPPATGTWSLLGGAGTIVDPSDPQTDVTDLPVGITTLLWTLDNGPCPDNGILTDTVSIF
ncbi:MAG: hypothetical protein KDC12_16035, partial [Flavobacteriales bacterium]|nr:hypothetical protein [Flavobacteriales bacterium]